MPNRIDYSKRRRKSVHHESGVNSIPKMVSPQQFNYLRGICSQLSISVPVVMTSKTCSYYIKKYKKLL